MKVEVENQPQGLATLRIELPPEDVRKEWDAIASNYSRYARIPGYRAGKAPRQVIEKKFRKEIQDELTKALVSKSYHEAIAEKQLRVVSLTDVGDVEFGEDRSMRFRATVVTAPEFELPDYKNIPVQLPAATVTEAEVEAALERLRDQSADFVDVAGRSLAMGDFAVIDFTGRSTGCRSARSSRRRARICTAEKILAPSGAGKFSAAVLRANCGNEAGRHAQRPSRVSGRFSGAGTRGEKGRLRGDAE